LKKRWLVTGGAGFIGTNIVERLLSLGDEVVVIDDLSRNGSDRNLGFLEKLGTFQFLNVKIGDDDTIQRIISNVERCDVVLHLAAQVSLLASIDDPMHDFRVNAIGTVQLLELVRKHWPHALMIYASSNKVYGDLGSVSIVEWEKKFEAPEYPEGFDETLPLEFHGGYSCSKGAADQYVLDYHRIYGLNTIVLRQSAICGRHQNPRADQGWASFLVQETIAKREVQLNGVGKQVRDLLDVEDLVNLYVTLAAMTNGPRTRAFNVGGGATRAMSLLELFDALSERGLTPQFRSGDYRPSDQMVYVSNSSALARETGWEPKISLSEIIDRLIQAESV
jgi:CDP-paratose 2-epimerase